MHPDRVHSRAEPDVDTVLAACARCSRRTDAEAMKLWSERRRFRISAQDTPGGFRYDYGWRHYGVCGACHERLTNGGHVADLKRRRGVAALLAAIVAGLLLALAMPVALPMLMSAFWQTGGTGR